MHRHKPNVLDQPVDVFVSVSTVLAGAKSGEANKRRVAIVMNRESIEKHTRQNFLEHSNHRPGLTTHT